MGHDINAFRSDPKFAESEEYFDKSHLAYLRRGAFDPHRKGIYIALGALDQYGDVGGCGGVLEYQPTQIVAAIDSIQKLDSVAGFTPRQQKSTEFMRSVAESLGGTLKTGLELAAEQGQDLSEVDYSRELNFLRQCNTQESVWIHFA